MITIRWMRSMNLPFEATDEEKLAELRRCLREYTLDPRLAPFSSNAPAPLSFFGNFVEYSMSFSIDVDEATPWAEVEEWFALIRENMLRPEYAQAIREQAAHDKWWRRNQTREMLKQHGKGPR